MTLTANASGCARSRTQFHRATVGPDMAATEISGRGYEIGLPNWSSRIGGSRRPAPILPCRLRCLPLPRASTLYVTAMVAMLAWF